MANRYVRSTDGSDADDGSTWALSKATLVGVAAIDTAGDRLFLSSVHSETTAGAISIALAGTVASPSSVLSGNDAAEPPTSLSRGATVATTGGSSHITMSGHAYINGVDFIAGDSTNLAQIRLCDTSGNAQFYDDCTFYVRGANSAGGVLPTNATTALQTKWKNCSVKFSHAGQGITLRSGRFIWEGGGILSGGTSPTNLFKGANGASDGVMSVSGLDLSNADPGINLFSSFNVQAVIRNSKLPASWSGSLYSGTMGAGNRVEMHNCDSADTNYRIAVQDFTGTLIQETTIVKSGGASDGTTALSWKMTSSANCNFLSGRFQSTEIVRWNDTTGSAITATVEIVHDSLTALNNDEVWLEVQYLGTSGYPKGDFADDAKADVLATAAPQAPSSATWTTTGLTNPNAQKLEVTFTPQEKGYIHARVCMGKASYTIYVDPLLTVA